jgi:hypothetical protein
VAYRRSSITIHPQFFGFRFSCRIGINHGIDVVSGDYPAAFYSLGHTKDQPPINFPDKWTLDGLHPTITPTFAGKTRLPEAGTQLQACSCIPTQFQRGQLFFSCGFGRRCCKKTFRPLAGTPPNKRRRVRMDLSCAKFYSQMLSLSRISRVSNFLMTLSYC